MFLTNLFPGTFEKKKIQHSMDTAEDVVRGFFICLFSVFPLMFKVFISFYPFIKIENTNVLLFVVNVIILIDHEHCSILFIKNRLSQLLWKVQPFVVII